MTTPDSLGESRGQDPAWVREIVSLLVNSGLFVVSGNIRDLYFSAEGAPLDALEVLGDALRAHGFADIAVVRPGGLDSAPVDELWTAGLAAGSAAGRQRGAAPPSVPTALLGRVAQQVNLLRPAEGAPRGRALIVVDASRAVSDPGALSVDESDMFREVQRAVSDQVVAPGNLYQPIIWFVDAPHDVPAWFVGSTDAGRSISVPLPSSTERAILSSRLLRGSLRDEPDELRALSQRLLADQTDGLPLVAVSQIASLMRRLGGGSDSLGDAVRLYRYGVLDNPWKQGYLIEKLRSELSRDATPGRPKLRERVIGQEAAIDKAIDVLTRSVTGLRSAQGDSRGGRPRGVLFFAGPTGVGKTELAKALASLLYGDDSALVRFDMSEFASSHAAERLVGAPPGYVGFAQGGELTNAVRQRPFSLLLFDEIEKANQALLDRFLQILDDGRLTDGRGETTYFSETLIVFTSNLGVYDTVLDPVTREPVGRRLVVEPADGHEALVQAVTSRVQDHFTSVVGRPELLNRIGDNIVVFDFIRRSTGQRILRSHVDRVASAVRRQYGVELRLEEAAWQVLEAECLSEANLMMGGRGIGNLLESVLIDPLARWVFASDVSSAIVVRGIAQQGHRWSLTVERA